MKYIVYMTLFSMLFNSSCDNITESKSGDENVQKTDTINLKPKYDKRIFDGVWAENEMENAAFMIKGDSIYFMEQITTPFYFETKEDSFIFYYPEGVYKQLIIMATSDSLILKDGPEILKYYKRKE